MKNKKLFMPDPISDSNQNNWSLWSGTTGRIQRDKHESLT